MKQEHPRGEWTNIRVRRADFETLKLIADCELRSVSSLIAQMTNRKAIKLGIRAPRTNRSKQNDDG